MTEFTTTSHVSRGPLITAFVKYPRKILRASRGLKDTSVVDGGRSFITGHKINAVAIGLPQLYLWSIFIGFVPIFTFISFGSYILPSIRLLLIFIVSILAFFVLFFCPNKQKFLWKTSPGKNKNSYYLLSTKHISNINIWNTGDFENQKVKLYCCLGLMKSLPRKLVCREA